MNGVRRPVWLLVGASGRVGRMLIRSWSQKPPADIVVLPQHRHAFGHGLLWDPLAGAAPLQRWIDDHGALAGIFLLAGATPGPSSDFDLNGALATAVLAAAREAGIPRVIYASSSAVYGAARMEPWSEAAPVDPVSAYGLSKLAAEGICNAAHSDGIDVACLRIGNVVGADNLMLMATAATAANPLKLDRFLDGGGPVRSYIGPQTLASVLAGLAVHNGRLPPVINVAAPVPVAMSEMLDAAGVPWQYAPAPVKALQYMTLDCGLLASLHDFSADAHQPATMIREWRAVRDPT